MANGLTVVDGAYRRFLIVSFLLFGLVVLDGISSAARMRTAIRSRTQNFLRRRQGVLLFSAIEIFSGHIEPLGTLENFFGTERNLTTQLSAYRSLGDSK